MSDKQQTRTLAPEWHYPAADTLRALQIAQRLAASYATPEAPAPVLVPALVVSLAVLRAAGSVCKALHALAGVGNE